MLKLEKTKFENLLQQVSIFSKGKPVFDPVKIVATKSGLEVKMSDQSKTVAVIAKYLPEYFEVFDILEGEYIISSEAIYKAVKKAMKGVPYVEVEFDEQTITLRGEGTKITETLRVQDIVDVDKFEVFEGVAIPPLNLLGAYAIEPPELVELGVKDIVELKFGKDVKAFGYMTATTGIEKTLSIKPLKEPTKQFAGRYSADYVERVARLFKLSAVLCVMGKIENDAVDVGPIVIGRKADEYMVSYWIAPMSV